MHTIMWNTSNNSVEMAAEDVTLGVAKVVLILITAGLPSQFNS